MRIANSTAINLVYLTIFAALREMTFKATIPRPRSAMRSCTRCVERKAKLAKALADPPASCSTFDRHTMSPRVAVGFMRGLPKLISTQFLIMKIGLCQGVQSASVRVRMSVWFVSLCARPGLKQVCHHAR